MLSVTKTDDASWDVLKPLIMAELMDYLATGEEIIPTSTPDENDIVGQIKSLLNARIRPAVKKDGGDIRFINFEDGIVTVEMQGSCKGCPYAMRTLKDGVERILKSYIPQVTEVRNLDEEGA
jgi:Fe-S cluster biogenesis protein NfuA